MRNVVITGGSRGIGDACAEKFAKNGDRVFIIYEKNDAKAQALCEKCGAIPVKADISTADGAEIAEKGYSLTPGAYVGVTEIEDDGVNFAERMAEIHSELLTLQVESNQLMETISKNMKELGL